MSQQVTPKTDKTASNEVRKIPKLNRNIILSIFLLIAITFSIVTIVMATAPDPGHNFTESSGGVVQGDLLFGSAADTLLALAKSALATRYLSNTGTTNNPAWAQVDLTNGVTGTLPGVNGGTGVANTSKTITLGGNLTTAGAFNTTLTVTADSNATLPAGTKTLVATDVATLSSLTSVGTIGTGNWNADVIVDGKIASALTGKTYNGVTPVTQAGGFTIAGGTTPKTLTVTGDATISGTPLADPMTTIGDIIIRNGSNVTARLAGAAGFLKGGVSTAPSWSAINLAASADVGTSILPTANGGTGIAYFTAAGPTAARIYTFPDANATIMTNPMTTLGDIIYGGASGAPTRLADVAVGSYLRSGGVGAAPVWSTLTLPNAGTTGDILFASATNIIGNLADVAVGRVLISGGVGVAPSYSPTPTLGVAGATLGTLSLAGNTSGVITIQSQAAAGTYNFNLPITAGSAGQPLLSGGGVGAAMTFGTLGVAQGGTGLAATADDAVFVGDSASAVTARTLPSCSGATTDKLLYNISTNSFSCGADQTAAGGTPQPYYPNRQWCYLRPLGTTAIVFTSVGCAAFVSTGTGVASGQTDSYYITQPSAATINLLAGISQTTIQTQGRYRPKLTALIRTDSVITSRRIWVGLHSVANSTTAGMQGSDLTGAQTDRYVGVRYSTSASDTQWQCCSGDGTTGSCLTTGVTVAVSTAYKIVVDWSVNGTLTCTVNGTSVNKATNLDATQTANLGLHAALTTLTAAIRNHLTAFVHLETN